MAYDKYFAHIHMKEKILLIFSSAQNMKEKSLRRFQNFLARINPSTNF